MVNRPAWTKAIQQFIGDEVIDEKYGYPADGSDDELLDDIERLVNDRLCRAYGHEVEDDQCMNPAHRYCIYCRRRESEITNGESPPEPPAH